MLHVTKLPILTSMLTLKNTWNYENVTPGMFDVKKCCYSVEVTHITRQFYIILNIIQYACRMQKYEGEIFFLPFIAFFMKQVISTILFHSSISPNPVLTLHRHLQEIGHWVTIIICRLKEKALNSNRVSRCSHGTSFMCLINALYMQ